VDFKDFAVFGAIIAALITSYFSLRVASEQRKTQNSHWLLGRKQEAYVRFLDARREMMNLSTREKDPGALLKARNKLLPDLRPTEIQLLAPPHIGEAARRIYSATKDLISDEFPGALDPDIKTKSLKIRAATDDLREMMKDDLSAGLEVSTRWDRLSVWVTRKR
jgi:hypothetical protein